MISIYAPEQKFFKNHFYLRMLYFSHTNEPEAEENITGHGKTTRVNQSTVNQH